MNVQTGQQAPGFQLFTSEKQPFRLEEYRGKKNVLLLFFPGAFTSTCTSELNQVNNELEEYLEHEVQVVGISTDSPFALAEYKKQQGFFFPLVSDHNGEVSATYGAKYDQDFTPMKLDRISRRAAFVVDKEGKIRYAEVLESAGDLPDFDAIKATLGDL